MREKQFKDGNSIRKIPKIELKKMKLSMKGKKLQTLNDPKTWNSHSLLAE